MKEFRKWSFIWFAVMLLLVAGSSYGTDDITVTVVNNTGVPAADLHVYFSGAGGNIVVDPLAVVALGCPTPLIPSNPPTVTSTAVIDWGTACVEPGAAVTFIAATMNGPLTVDSACWTDTLGMFIGCADSVITGPGPGPGPKFGAIKIQVRCVPRFPPIYIGWFPPGTHPFPSRKRCWARWCCIPTTDYYYRVIYCPFATRLARFLEFPPWIRLTGWIKDGTIGPRYFWRFQTWPPPPDSILPKGPPPEIPLPGQEPFGPEMHDVEVRNSDDSGKTFRPATDFASSFFDIYYHIQLVSDSAGSDTLTNFNDQLQRHAPGYARAAEALSPLINEIQDLNTFEPQPWLPGLFFEILNFQEALFRISSFFSTGQVGDTGPYLQARDALLFLENIFQVELAPLSLRYGNAADNLGSIAQGFDACVQAIVADSAMVTQEQQDVFRWGLFNRFQLNLPALAMGCMPHVRVQVDLGTHEWAPTIFDHNVRVITQSETSCEIVETHLPISDLSEFDIVSLSDISKNAGNMRLWFKVPGYLGKQVDFAANDGSRVGPLALIQGDVNGDNHVDELDLAQVDNDLGLGGLGDTVQAVPSSDVNADGVVDSTDLQIVIDNLGQWGDDFTPYSTCAVSCCVGNRGDLNGDGDDANILDLTFAVDRIFRGGPPPPCPEEGDYNADGSSTNILDLTALVDRIFRGGQPPEPC